MPVSPTFHRRPRSTSPRLQAKITPPKCLGKPHSKFKQSFTTREVDNTSNRLPDNMKGSLDVFSVTKPYTIRLDHSKTRKPSVSHGTKKYKDSQTHYNKDSPFARRSNLDENIENGDKEFDSTDQWSESTNGQIAENTDLEKQRMFSKVTLQKRQALTTKKSRSLYRSFSKDDYDRDNTNKLRDMKPYLGLHYASHREGDAIVDKVDDCLAQTARYINDANELLGEACGDDDMIELIKNKPDQRTESVSNKDKLKQRTQSHKTEQIKWRDDHRPQSSRTCSLSPSRNNKRSKSRYKTNSRVAHDTLDEMFADVFRNLIHKKPTESCRNIKSASEQDGNNCHLEEEIIIGENLLEDQLSSGTSSESNSLCASKEGINNCPSDSHPAMTDEIQTCKYLEAISGTISVSAPGPDSNLQLKSSDKINFITEGSSQSLTVEQTSGVEVSTNPSSSAQNNQNCKRNNNVRLLNNDNSEQNSGREEESDTNRTVSSQSLCPICSKAFESSQIGDANPPAFCLSVRESQPQLVSPSPQKTIYTKVKCKFLQREKTIPGIFCSCSLLNPDSCDLIEICEKKQPDHSKTGGHVKDEQPAESSQRVIKANDKPCLVDPVTVLHALVKKNTYDVCQTKSKDLKVHTSALKVPSVCCEVDESISLDLIGPLVDEQICKSRENLEDVTEDDRLFAGVTSLSCSEILRNDKEDLIDQSPSTTVHAKSLTGQEYALSETNLSDAVVIMSDIKRYQSFEDLTDLNSENEIIEMQAIGQEVNDDRHSVNLNDTNSLEILAMSQYSKSIESQEKNPLEDETKINSCEIKPKKLMSRINHSSYCNKQNDDIILHCVNQSPKDNKQQPVHGLAAFQVFKNLEKQQAGRKGDDINGNCNSYQSESIELINILPDYINNNSEPSKLTLADLIFSKNLKLKFNQSSSKPKSSKNHSSSKKKSSIDHGNSKTDLSTAQTFFKKKIRTQSCQFQIKNEHPSCQL